MELPQFAPGQVVGRWRVDKKLGEGGFGAVYKVSGPTAGGLAALKVEGAQEASQVRKMEVLVLEELLRTGRNRHFCSILDRGRNQSINYVVMTFVGPSLQDLRKTANPPNQFLSMGTALFAGMQCLEGLEDLHFIGYLHRDVKPGNYAIGRAEVGEQKKVYVLDFGMCRGMISPRTGRKKTPRERCGFRGTIRYASINCHDGVEMCEKDDLEQWFYQQVELTKGILPWRDMQDKDQVLVAKRRARDPNYGLKELLGGCPREYVQIFQYIDTLKYHDQPDYQRVYTLLRQAAQNAGINPNDPYDWERRQQFHR